MKNLGGPTFTPIEIFERAGRESSSRSKFSLGVGVADENLFLRVTILLLFSFLLVGWQGFVIQTNEKEEWKQKIVSRRKRTSAAGAHGFSFGWAFLFLLKERKEKTAHPKENDSMCQTSYADVHFHWWPCQEETKGRGKQREISTATIVWQS